MKRIILILTIISSSIVGYSQSVGIGTTTPNGKSILELSSTTQGLLPPRMTTLQRMGIAPGATEFGLVVYDTDLAGFYFWDGASWKTMGGADTDWLTNGTHMYNGNTGNVGIGIANPKSQLQVGSFAGVNTAAGNAHFTGNLYHDGLNWRSISNGYSAFINIEPGIGSIGLYTTSFANADDIPVETRRMIIANNGNIGIGVDAPTTKLHINNGNVSPAFRLTDGTQAAGRVLTTDANGNASWQDAAGGNAWELTGNTGSTAVNFLGTTDNVSLRFRTNNIERARIDSIGTFVVDKKILNYPSTINSGKEGSPSTFVLGTYSNTAEHNPRINLARHRGTYASPTAIQSGDWIGSLGFRGYDGANYPVAGSIFVNSSENWSTTQQGAIMTFETTANGESAPSERMRIHSNGNVGVNSFDPKAKLQVFGTSNTSVLDSINQNRTSLGAQRFHFSTGDVFDIGFQSLPNYAAWMQAGFNGTAEPILLNPNGGNIGIGNNNPTARLHVSGNFRLEDGTQAAGRILTSDAAGNASWQAPSSSINIYNSNGSLTANRTITQDTNTLAFTSSVTNGFNVDGNTFSVDALNNRVGIGTTTPNAKLHIDFGGAQINQYNNQTGLTVSLNNNAATNASAFVWSNATVAALNVDMAGTSTDVATFRNTGNIVSRMLSDGSVQFNGRLLPGGVQGLAGQVLTSNGTGTPTWQTISASSLGAVTGAGAATRVAFWNGTNSLSSNTELYWDNTNNRLGVGTSVPSAKLHLYGSNDPLITLDGPVGSQVPLAFATAGTNKWSWYMPGGGNDLSLWHYSAPSQNYLTFNGANGNISLAPTSGNVGIGTASPTTYSKLHLVLGNTGNNENLRIQSPASNLGFGLMLQNPSKTWEVGMNIGNFSDNRFQIFDVSSSTAAVTILSDGKVGIGTTTAPAHPLEVGAAGFNTLVNSRYFIQSTNNLQFGSYNSLVSIKANGGVWSTEGFYASSDARIKDIVGVSNSNNDLQLLNNIKITDYTMKDKVEYGNKPFKKVIAQELETLYPQAVSKTNEFIPNIYELATNLQFDETTKILTTSLKNIPDCKSGDFVKVITEKGNLEYEVMSVSDFIITFKNVESKPENVFVYGKKVDDFRTVDYEALTTLNISATQELFKLLQSQQTKINELETKVQTLDQLKQENASLKSDMDIVKQHLGIEVDAQK